MQTAVRLRVIGALFAAGMVGYTTPGNGCSRVLFETPLETKFAQAPAVFLGRVFTIRLERTNQCKGCATEFTTITVLKTWKGAYRPGDLVEFESSITPLRPGSCGNPAFSAQDFNYEYGVDPLTVIPTGSGAYVLFAYGSTPQMRMGEGSALIEFAGQTMNELDSLVSLPVRRGRRGVVAPPTPLATLDD